MKPMLAANDACDFSVLERVRYPIDVQPKYDGIRCVLSNGTAMSRTWKPLPNLDIQTGLDHLPSGLDGEIMVRAPGGGWLPFPQIQGFVMAETPDELDWVYMVFDDAEDPIRWYCDRYRTAHLKIAGSDHNRVQIVRGRLARNPDEVKAVYSELLAAGYEGAILRDPEGPYKHGRATLKQGWLLKLKPREDAEAEVLELLPLQRNDNPQQRNELGYAKRSTAKAGRRSVELLGTIRARVLNGRFAGKEFACGFRGTDAERAAMFAAGDALLGEAFTFTFSPDPGYELPRQPVFKAWRRLGPDGQPAV